MGCLFSCCRDSEDFELSSEHANSNEGYDENGEDIETGNRRLRHRRPRPPPSESHLYDPDPTTSNGSNVRQSEFDTGSDSDSQDEENCLDCKEYVLKSDYEHERISLKQLDKIHLIEKEDRTWIAHKPNRSKRFAVPDSVVAELGSPELLRIPYYFGNITTQEAKELKDEESKAGTFLIRDGDQDAEYYLVVFEADAAKELYVKNYKITKNEKGRYVLFKADFGSICDLIQYYQGTKDKLSCKLTKPCRKEYITGTKPDDCSDCKVCVVLFEFKAREIDELSITPGDKIHVFKDDDDWWLAHTTDSDEVGYIPGIYVAEKSSHRSYSWYHGNLTTVEARELILKSNPEAGTFLVRDSQTEEGAYTISVYTKTSDNFVVKHHRINHDGGSYYLNTKEKYSTLQKLIKHYQDGKNPLLILKKACERQKPALSDLSHKVKDKWEIPRKELKIKEKLGAGHFCTVHRGYWKNNTEVAIKQAKPDTMSEKQLKDEVKLMKKLSHKNILPLYGVCTTKDILIVTELMPYGDLKSYLEKNDLGLQVLVFMAAQIANGMAYLEDNNFIHRDLAARNVLVREKYVCKVSDFGLSRAVMEEIYTSTTTTNIPIRWTAPEALQKGLYSTKSDVWSFGILLVELFTKGATPFKTIKTNKVVKENIKRGVQHPKPPNCPGDIYEIMRECWEKEPSERPSFHYLHEKFDKYEEDPYAMESS